MDIVNSPVAGTVLKLKMMDAVLYSGAKYSRNHYYIVAVPLDRENAHSANNIANIIHSSHVARYIFCDVNTHAIG